MNFDDQIWTIETKYCAESKLCFRFGVWEAAKWVARVRQNAIYDPKRPILLNLTVDLVEENKYLSCKESALETAFLIKTMDF